MEGRLAPDTLEAGLGLVEIVEVDDDVVHEVRAHPREVGDDRDAMRSEMLCRTNPRQHEDVRGVYSTRSTTPIWSYASWMRAGCNTHDTTTSFFAFTR